MLTSDSALDALLAKVTHCAHAMLEAAESMAAETRRSVPQGALRVSLDAIGDRLSGTAQDVAHDLRELDGLWREPSSEPVRARIERVAAWLEADGDALHALLDRLRTSAADGDLPRELVMRLAGTAEGVLRAIAASCSAIDAYRASLR